MILLKISRKYYPNEIKNLLNIIKFHTFTVNSGLLGLCIYPIFDIFLIKFQIIVSNVKKLIKKNNFFLLIKSGLA